KPCRNGNLGGTRRGWSEELSPLLGGAARAARRLRPVRRRGFRLGFLGLQDDSRPPRLTVRRGLLGGGGVGARGGLGGFVGRVRRGRGGAFGGLGGAGRGVAASDLHLVGRHVVDDDPAGDRIGALGEDRVVGQGDDVVDFVHVDVSAFAHHVHVLAVGALAKHCR